MAEELVDARAPGTVFLGFVVPDFGQVHTREHHSDAQHQNAQHGVGNDDVAAALRTVEKELADEERGRERAQPVERLREVEPAGGAGRIAQLSDIGIGRSLQKHQPAANDEQRT